MSVVTPLGDVLPSEALAGQVAWGPWLAQGAAPEAVVHPESTEEVAATLRWAAANGVSVVPLGSGRRMTPTDAWPGGRFIAMSTSRLAGVEIYEPADLTLTAGAGTRLDALGEELHAHGQWLPFDPPHAPERTLGGLVATGESGPLWMGHGELRNHVLGMTVVSGDGRTLKLGGRVVKNVAGFDMLKPMVGSRGQLAVITSICLRTFPEPATDRLLRLEAESPTALAVAALGVGMAPVMPVSCVLVMPAGDSGAALFVRLQGGERTVDTDQRSLEQELGVSFEVMEPATSVTATGRDRATEGEVVLGIAVRPSRLGEALSVVDELPAVEVVADTYAAHLRVSAAATDLDVLVRLRESIESLGGTLSVRAGGGSATIASAPPAAVRELTSRLRHVFDPQGVLWPPRA